MLPVVGLDGEEGVLVVTSLTPTTSWRNATVTAARKQGAHLFIRWTNMILFLHSKPSQLSLPSVPRRVTGSLHQRVLCLCFSFLQHEGTSLGRYSTCCIALRSFLCRHKAGNPITWPVRDVQIVLPSFLFDKNLLPSRESQLFATYKLWQRASNLSRKGMDGWGNYSTSVRRLGWRKGDSEEFLSGGKSLYAPSPCWW